MTETAKGSKLVCDALADAGVRCVFGLPGTQNVTLFDALRTSNLRTVVATHELSAAMMANGYHRASGRLAALVTIPGPGFLWALTGIAEAALDSAALIHLVGTPASCPGQHYQLQAIDQATIVGPITRAAHRVEHAGEIAAIVERACADAVRSEPGPVTIQIAREALDERAASIGEAPQPSTRVTIDDAVLDEIAALIRSARRCLLFVGQGCHAASASLVRLIEALSAAVVTTTSGRGAVAEDHPLSLGFELGGSDASTLNEVVAASDLVLAIGCKFSHNGSRGFELRIPQEKLVHVDTCAQVLGANYPARIALRADAGAFIAAMLERIGSSARPGFDAAELQRLRERANAEAVRGNVEPRIHGVASGQPAEFFAILRKAMPRTAILVTDSGLHQSLARRHFRVLSPRGLITPTNLQSMGFAIGAAIGARIAAPDRAVVALVGDGGLAMSGLELLTAVRERLRLVVIAFVDGAYGLIRMQQLAATGQPFATEFEPVDVAALAEATGAHYARLQGDAESVLHAALQRDGVTLVEVGVGDTLPMHWMRAKALAKRSAGPRARSWLRRLRGRS